MIRTHDHSPPHVHVERGKGLTKSHLKIDLESFKVSQVRNCTSKEVKLMICVVQEHQLFLLQEWRKYAS